MANTITLKRRIGSVKNTKQITKAMELVAASKMRRAQEYAAHGRVYREAAYSLLTRLSAITEVSEHPLFTVREVKTRTYIAITSNRGLAGAYNANVNRMLTRAIAEDRKVGIKSSVIAVGKQAANFVRRIEGVELLAAFDAFDDHPSSNEVRPLLNIVVEMYSEAKTDDVQLVFTQFKSNINQVTTKLGLLPARYEEMEGVKPLDNTTFEPSISVVLGSVTERLLEVQLWQALLESIASEHSMRMLAMKNATDNATDLIADLTLAFNTARQAAITQELAEITGGAEAMK